MIDAIQWESFKSLTENIQTEEVAFHSFPWFRQMVRNFKASFTVTWQSHEIKRNYEKEKLVLLQNSFCKKS
jgi:isopentenyldiphosphate isomerase